MSPLITLKDTGRESQIFNFRVIFSLICMGLLFVFLAFRLADLQIIQHEHFTTRSKENRVRIVPLAPPRGLIFSSDGTLLAENIPVFTLEVVPEQAGDIDQLIVDINSVLGLNSDEIERFKRELKRKRSFEKTALKYNLTEGEIARFSVNRHRFPGVDISPTLIRHYPKGEAFAHIIGYVGRINEEEEKLIDKANYSASRHIGKTGVEKAYEPLLHGQVGYQQVEINAQGRVLRVLKKELPQPGSDIYLTLDMELQAVAAKAMEKYRGAVVAIDPDTGAILSMVSTPSFDPNWFVNGISSEQYQKLSQSRDRPLFNRALQGQYPPGSTFKPFLAVAGSYLGVIESHTRSWCPGWFRLPGNDHRYRCWNKSGHGGVDLHRSIVESCDIYFYELALELGIDRIHGYLQGFGFGKVTGIDLSAESGGLLPSREWKLKSKGVAWYPGETLITGIGQGYLLTTPIQLASATATLSKKGQRALPRVVGQIENPVTGESGNRLADLPELSVVANDEDWQHVIDAMRDVVHGARGTARHLSVGTNYKFAGKTGTVQVFALHQQEDEQKEAKDISEYLQDHALFVAFAPLENPKIAVAVVVENGGSGSKTAGPIAKQLLDQYLLRK